MHRRQLPKTFSKSAAPAGYVAGLGRGAVGFTTQGDVGPAFARTNFGQAPAGYVPGAGRGAIGAAGRGIGEPSQNQEESGDFDEFTGYSGSLFSKSDYDEADKDADKVWEAVEERLKRKRRKKTSGDDEKGVDDSQESSTRAKVADQFADLKQQLQHVTYEEWDALPEASTGIRSHKREDKFTPVSDAVILSKHSANQIGSTSLSIERGRMMRDRLDQGGKGNQASVDADGYLTSLAGLDVSANMAQVGDIKKARLLLKSVTNSNPGHGPGWIAAARLEEVAGDLAQARKIIRAGCQACPRDEDVWIEASRLNTPSNAKIVLENAVRKLPNSVRIWQAAADLEHSDPESKKRVLRRALETIPNSEKLWMALIEMEESESDAHVLLARAVECVPHSVDMWLALAKMEEYEQAKRVLNVARKKNPAEPRIWVAACALEEAHAEELMEANPNNRDEAEAALDRKLKGLLGKAVKALSSDSNMLVDREAWLHLAKQTEKTESIHTCRAIVHATLTLGLEQADWKRTWMDDAQSCIATGHFETARALFRENIEAFPGQKQVLIKAVSFESAHGTKESLQRLLQYAVSKCPEAELFWLMAAKETWKTSNDVDGARDFLSRAFVAGHNSERVWLAAFKLEWENGFVDRARALLHKARQSAPTAGVFLKSALLERVELSKLDPSDSSASFSNKLETVEQLLRVACEKFPSSPKLWMMAADVQIRFRIHRAQNSAEKNEAVRKARDLYLQGLKASPSCGTLWILASRLEETFVAVVKARSVLELARAKCPGDADVWLESVRLEERHGEKDMARANLAKALQECPKSGKLWAHVVLTASKPEQRAKSADALEHCESDSHVFAALGEMFARDKKKKAAKKWFEKAVATNPDNADAWLGYLEFQLHQGSNETMSILERFIAAAPRHGERWQAVAKLDANRHKPILDVIRQILPHTPTLPPSIKIENRNA